MFERKGGLRLLCCIFHLQKFESQHKFQIRFRRFVHYHRSDLAVFYSFEVDCQHNSLIMFSIVLSVSRNLIKFTNMKADL